jgi:Cu(I)/Ag(I) efflux system protein CusF
MLNVRSNKALALLSFVKSSRHLCLAVALLPVATFTLCDRSVVMKERTAQRNVSGPEAAVATATYHSLGVVKSLNAKLPSIEIDHEDIEGLMPAMTMDFYLRDQSLLAGLKLGDRVEFTIENGVGGLKVTEIRKR